MRKAFLTINALLTLSLIAQLYLAALGVFSAAGGRPVPVPRDERAVPASRS